MSPKSGGLQQAHQIKMPITAIVVGLNEGHLLETCLPSISFCDEVLYVDLGSSDGSEKIAQEYRATVRQHALVPSGEHALATVYPEARHDWILFIDPDESLAASLRDELVQCFEQSARDPSIGAFSAPWQFYFKGRKLTGTPWGGRRPRLFLAHRTRFRFLAETHRGRLIEAGYRVVHLDRGGSIEHNWSNSWVSLVRKHLRYLRTEGGSRFRRGDRISLGGLVVSIPKLFVQSFSSVRSPDGVTGLALTLLFFTYKVLALVSLWRFQSKRI